MRFEKTFEKRHELAYEKCFESFESTVFLFILPIFFPKLLLELRIFFPFSSLSKLPSNYIIILINGFGCPLIRSSSGTLP